MKTRIAELRRKADLSQSELAERIGTKATMLGKLERGERDLTTAWINKLAVALDVSPAALFTAPENHVHAGWIERNGEVGLHSDHPSPSLTEGFQLEVKGPKGEVIGVFGDAVERFADKPANRQSFMVEPESITLSLPRDTQIVANTLLGGPLREELTNRLAIITTENDDQKILGIVVRPRGSNTFVVVPIGGAPMPDAVVKRIDPVMEIHLPVGELG